MRHRLTPQKNKIGRRVLVNTPRRKELVEWVTANKTNRETLWREIPAILKWNCGERAIRTALQREGFTRCVQRKKCVLTADHAADRLAWALEHVDWEDEDWDRVLFTDETWA